MNNRPIQPAPPPDPAEPSGARGASDHDPACRRAPRPARERLGRLAEAIVPKRSAGAVAYGLVAVGALLAAESGLHETYLDTVASAAIASCLYWLLHAYAGLLGRRVAERERVSAAALGQALAHELPILRGAAVPLAALVLAWAAGVQQADGVTIALWSSISGLVTFELAAALRAGARGSELAVELLVGLALGMGVLALRIVLH